MNPEFSFATTKKVILVTILSVLSISVLLLVAVQFFPKGTPATQPQPIITTDSVGTAEQTLVLEGVVTEIDPESGMFQIYSGSNNVVYTINPDAVSNLPEEIVSGMVVQIEAVPDAEDNALFHANSINFSNNVDQRGMAMPSEFAPAYEE